MDKLPVGQLPDLTQSNNDDEIMVITDSEHNQLKKEKISDLITDFTSTNENNALTKGTDGKMFVTDFGNASNITEGTLPASVLPEIPLDKIPDIPKDKLPPIETADLPVSGVIADTYAYPSSVTVNAQGQVTAIEEGKPGANNANQDLSNISEAGKEVIRETAGSDYHLTQNQITNCILEIPQNIKYTLEDGVLTIKAGTIITVPYGTTDQSSTYPVGSTFLNNNFKVVKTYFTDNKFFVQAEVQADASVSSAAGDNNRMVGLTPQNNGTYNYIDTACYSGTTAPTNTDKLAIWYDTANNVIKRTNNSGVSWNEVYFCLPLLFVERANQEWTQVLNVFNGMGYIGSTFWLDKGVKLLFPNGRNSDGTLNNIEVENTKLLRLNLNNSSGYTTDYEAYLTCSYNNSNGNTVLNIGYITADRYFETDNLDEIPQEERNAVAYRPSFNDFWWYNASEDKWYERIYCITGEMYYNYSTASKILEFKPRNTFRAVDDFDLRSKLSKNALYSTVYINGTSGYREWFSDEALSNRVLLEQWGTLTSSNQTITFLKEMSDTNYNISLGANVDGGLSGNQSGGWREKTTTGFYLQFANVNTMNWRVIGV